MTKFITWPPVYASSQKSKLYNGVGQARLYDLFVESYGAGLDIESVEQVCDLFLRVGGWRTQRARGRSWVYIHPDDHNPRILQTGTFHRRTEHRYYRPID